MLYKKRFVLGISLLMLICFFLLGCANLKHQIFFEPAFPLGKLNSNLWRWKIARPKAHGKSRPYDKIIERHEEKTKPSGVSERTNAITFTAGHVIFWSYIKYIYIHIYVGLKNEEVCSKEMQ